MSLALRFLGKFYLKYFFIILTALEGFFVGIDLLKFAEDLPSSANLVVLFVFYDALYALGFVLPLSLILAQILFLVVLARTGEFTALLSLGYSQKSISLPVFLLSLLFTILFVILNSTSFAYAREKVDSLLDKGYIGSFKRELFVKYNDSYVFFEKIYPLLQKGENVKVYTLRNGQLAEFFEAKEAHFMENHWQLINVRSMKLPEALKLGKSPLQVEKFAHMEILEGFRPRILDSIYEEQGAVSIVDALESLILLKAQQLNSQKIRGILYSLALFPFFAPLCMVFIARYMPITARYGNLASSALVAILGALLAWGIFFALSRLSMSGFIQPEASLLLPLLLFAGGAIWLWRRL
ncbi:MAG: LptF/LptG family permease [Wolinella sp.]